MGQESPSSHGSSVVLIAAMIMGGVLMGAILDRVFLPKIVSASDSPPVSVTAQRFIVVNKKGQTMGTFGAKGDSVFLTMNDSKGVRRIGVGLDAGGAGLNFFDPSGKTIRSSLHLRADGVTGITFYDRFGNPKAGIAIDATGGAASP